MVREHLFLFAVLTVPGLACGGETFRSGHDDLAGTSGSESGGSGGGGGSAKAGASNAGRGGKGTAGREPGSGGSGASSGSTSEGGSSSPAGGASAGTETGGDSGAPGAAGAGEGGAPEPSGGSSGSSGSSGSGGSSGSTAVPGSGPVNPVPAPGAAHALPNGDVENATPPVLAGLGDGVVVAGYTRDPAFIGLEEFEPGTVAEAFAARLAHDGSTVWAQPLYDSAIPTAITVDPEGDIVVLAPYTELGAQLNLGLMAPELYLAKLHPDGQFVYQRRLPMESDVGPYALAIDATGAIYVAGIYVNPNASNNQYLVLAKYDRDGFSSWTKIIAHTGADANASGLAVLPNGDVTLVGHFNGRIDFGGGELSVPNDDAFPPSDGFVARFTPDGNHVASARFGGPLLDTVMNVVALSDGDLVISGAISGEVEIGGLPGTGHAGEGSPFVARLDEALAARWLQVAPSRGFPYSLLADPDESLFHVAGLFSNNRLLFEYTADGELVLDAEASGTSIWTRSLALDSTNSLWLGGGYRYDANFGGDAIFQAENFGVYLVRLDRAAP